MNARTGDLVVRDADERDVPRITAIYAHHVLTGLATFEVVPPGDAEMARRRENVLGWALPYFVAEDASGVLGYAYAAPYRTRAGYRYTVEDSVYVDPAAVGRGVGRRLLERLVEACVACGCRQMIAVIGDTDNSASIGLHEACGFATSRDAAVDRLQVRALGGQRADAARSRRCRPLAARRGRGAVLRSHHDMGGLPAGPVRARRARLRPVGAARRRAEGCCSRTRTAGS